MSALSKAWIDTSWKVFSRPYRCCAMRLGAATSILMTCIKKPISPYVRASRVSWRQTIRERTSIRCFACWRTSWCASATNGVRPSRLTVFVARMRTLHALISLLILIQNQKRWRSWKSRQQCFTRRFIACRPPGKQKYISTTNLNSLRCAPIRDCSVCVQQPTTRPKTRCVAKRIKNCDVIRRYERRCKCEEPLLHPALPLVLAGTPYHALVSGAVDLYDLYSP